MLTHSLLKDLTMARYPGRKQKTLAKLKIGLDTSMVQNTFKRQVLLQKWKKNCPKPKGPSAFDDSEALKSYYR